MFPSLRCAAFAATLVFIFQLAAINGNVEACQLSRHKLPTQPSKNILESLPVSAPIF
jgi:hypothetical protein